ncbi:glycosyltransferase [Nanoarchaeota archaeon]
MSSPILIIRLENLANSGVRRINEIYEQMRDMADVQLMEPKTFKYRNIKTWGFFISAILEFVYSFYFIFKAITKYNRYKVIYLWPMSYTYLWLIPFLRLLGKKVAVDYNDDFYELSNKKNALRRIMFFFYYKIPQTIVPYLANYLIVTPYFEKRFLKKGISKRKMVAVRTGYDPRLFKKLKVKKSNKIEIGYFGSIDVRFDMNFVVKSFSEINNNKVRLNLFGTVAENHKKMNEPRIVYHGQIPHDDVCKKMNQMDILLNPFPYSLLANSASPVKVFEYMATEGCVLSSNIESVKGVLKDKENCSIYKPSDKNDFKKRLIELIENKKLRIKLSKQALKDSKKHQWYFVAEKIVNKLSP